MTKKDDESKAKSAHGFEDDALSARRARLRSSLAKQGADEEHIELKKSEHAALNSDNEARGSKEAGLGHAIESLGKNISRGQSATQSESAVLLAHIDQVLNSYTGYFASLQNAARQQVEELKIIAETLQSRAAYDSAQSLIPLTESLCAAIEPMKAIGELVPILDRLANANETKDRESNQFISSDKTDTESKLPFDEGMKKEFLLKEEELSRKLAEKELEIESIREQLDSQWHELAGQCEELRIALQAREEILQDKEIELNRKISELSAKDSENQQLKAQIAELKDKTKEMMTDLQNQLTKKQEEITKRQQEEGLKKQEEEKVRQPAAQSTMQGPQSGFFDFVSTGNSGNPLFATNPPSFFSEAESNSEVDEAAVVQNGENTGWRSVDSKTGAGFLATNNVSPEAPAANRSPLNMPNSGVVPNDVQTNTQGSASFVSAVGSYGSGVRAQVFEVVVRQALAGTQWRESCAVPMQSNNISPQEVEAEVKRRQALLKK